MPVLEILEIKDKMGMNEIMSLQVNLPSLLKSVDDFVKITVKDCR